MNEKYLKRLEEDKRIGKKRAGLDDCEQVYLQMLGKKYKR